ncbi:MAG: hypothetical protein FJ033_00810 [Chloroflexi bacterium]|nr:hypothetical protein [Chloroflexota bacterium]
MSAERRGDLRGAPGIRTASSSTGPRPRQSRQATGGWKRNALFDERPVDPFDRLPYGRALAAHVLLVSSDGTIPGVLRLASWSEY